MNNHELANPSTSATSNDRVYTIDNPFIQSFRFRHPIMNYILANPNGKFIKKLIKTCKLFFAKFRIYPVDELTYDDTQSWKADGQRFDPNFIVVKLWLINSFLCFSRLPLMVREFLAIDAKLNLQLLDIKEQWLQWNDYKLLTSSESLKDITFKNTSIKYASGHDVPIDKLVENLPVLESFIFERPFDTNLFDNNAVQKMDNILLNLEDMYFLVLSNLDERFDLSSMMDFFKKNEAIAVTLGYGYNLELPAATSKCSKDSSKTFF